MGPSFVSTAHVDLPRNGARHDGKSRAPSLMTLVTSEHALIRETHTFDGQRFMLPPFSVNCLVVNRAFTNRPSTRGTSRQGPPVLPPRRRRCWVCCCYHDEFT